MSSAHLLPPNATSAEIALSLSMARLADVEPRCREMWNPDTCPVEHLPWLAWALSVDEWNSAWSEAQKRAVIKASYSVHKHKGTIGALHEALDALGYDINVVEWFQEVPVADPYTFGLTADLGDDANVVDLWGDIEGVALAAKNVRSHLRYIRLRKTMRGKFYMGGIVLSAETTRIDPYALTELESHGSMRVGAGVFEHEAVTVYPPAFSPESLFANGEKGCLYMAGVEGAMFTDVARTIPVVNENDVIAAVADRSGNGCHAQKVTASQRPKMILSANNYRRRVDYDGVDDALTVPVPAMGSNCTVFRARPGIGGIITGGVTINGTQSDNTDFTVLGIIDRALTATEQSKLQFWLDQRSGLPDEYNIPYGADPSEILDVFHSSGHPARPIIFMVHGGAWRTGSKQSPNVIKAKLQHWIPKGFTFVSVNYKLDVGTDPLDQCRSVAKALAWVQAHAGSWGCIAENIVVMGHSAGAHLTTLMSSKQSFLDEFGVRPWLGNVVIDSAAYNVPLIMSNPTHLTLYDEPFGVGNIPHQIACSPTLVLDRTPPPMFLITSTDTNPGESDGLAGPYRDAVMARGGWATIYPTAYIHEETNSMLGLPNPYTAAVDDFLATKLGLQV